MYVWIQRLVKNLKLLRPLLHDAGQVILFFGGLYFAFNEIIVAKEADPEVLILVGGMIGVTAIWRA